MQVYRSESVTTVTDRPTGGKVSGMAPLALFRYTQQAGLDLRYLRTAIDQRSAPCCHARFGGHKELFPMVSS